VTFEPRSTRRRRVRPLVGTSTIGWAGGPTSGSRTESRSKRKRLTPARNVVRMSGGRACAAAAWARPPRMRLNRTARRQDLWMRTPRSGSGRPAIDPA
jgi:hypothetical protein